MTRRASILLASTTLVAGLIAGWNIHAWHDLDSCLDAGGRWDYAKQACDLG